MAFLKGEASRRGNFFKRRHTASSFPLAEFIIERLSTTVELTSVKFPGSIVFVLRLIFDLDESHYELLAVRNNH